MKISVLGTGMVGQALAGRLAALGHDVVVGTRDPAATLARTEPSGALPFSAWQAQHPSVRLVTLAEAGEHGEVLVNATSGGASLAALDAVGAESLAGKVVLDVANPLDFSNGFPPSLSVVNTDSLAEQLQRAHPEARVVKSLNTMSCQVMVDPKRLGADTDVFVAGDDEDAKAVVTGLLQELGWPAASVLDLGGLSSARGTEMFLPLWLSLMQYLGTGDFNVKIVKA
jgi:predicted dinucleotide-binding enzyme